MANIDKELNQIKNAVYGKDVRGSIHDGIDKINKETEVATDKSEQAHDVMESIINDGFDNAALESNFEQKLDDKIADLQPEWTQFKDQTNQQLAETDKEINVTKRKMNREIISPRFQNRKPMITILDDDCQKGVLTNWEPILNEKNFKLSLACITDKLENDPYNEFMTSSDLVRLKKEYDLEIVPHSHTHPYLTNLTESEIREEFEKSIAILDQLGLDSNIIVYPYGYSDVKVRGIAREYFRAGIDARVRDDYVNKPPLNTFNLMRPALMYHGTPMQPLSHYTDLIDQAISENGWLIFMSHSQFDSFDSDKIKQIIDYANSNDVEWVNLNEGLDRIGNIIDVGDNDPEAQAQGYSHTVFDAEGNLSTDSRTIGTHIITKANAYNINTPISEFPKRKIIDTLITGENQNNVGFPGNRPGLLRTYNLYSNGWNRQDYRVYNSNDFYTRHTKPDGSWSEFVPIGGANIHVETVDFGTIEGNSGVNKAVMIPGLTVDDIVDVYFKQGLATRVLPIAYVIADGQIRVRLENLTNESVTVGSRPIKLKITKA